MKEFPAMQQVFSTLVLKQVAQWLPFLTNNSRLLYYLVMHNQASYLQDAKRLYLMQADRVLD
jgi:hypothetical protein